MVVTDTRYVEVKSLCNMKWQCSAWISSGAEQFRGRCSCIRHMDKAQQAHTN